MTALERLRAELGWKVGVLLGLAVGICVPYFGLHALALAPRWQPPATFIDRAIPFDPAWAPAYLSVCLLVPLFPLCTTRRRELQAFAVGLLWLCLPSFAMFALLPVAGPRPELGAPTGAYGWLVGVDAATNAFPSLHAGLTVYCLMFGWRILGGELRAPARRALAASLWAWGAIILYATLATKQHWFWDLVPGALLAVHAHWRAWRWARPVDAARDGLPTSGSPAPRPSPRA